MTNVDNQCVVCGSQNENFDEQFCSLDCYENRVEQKRKELNNLEYSYNIKIDNEKKAFLKGKSEGLSKTFYLLGFEFESSISRTPQYLEFHRTFKREFNKYLSSLGVTEIDISKPNHFDFSGFFKYKEQIYYVSLSDLRYDTTFLIRTAKDFKDYSGGSNSFLSLVSEEEFKRQFERFIK